MSERTRTLTKKYLSDRLELLAPHPGIYYGQYPSKKQVSSGWLETIAKRLKKYYLDSVRPHRKEHREMLERVTTTYKVIESMTDVQLDRWIIDIKRKLHSKGLTDELMCRAFATIKEVSRRELNMSHYDSQLLGGWIMMQGMVAEMQTGEGKTLVATLPAYLNALTGKGVHIITVNDYTHDHDFTGASIVLDQMGAPGHAFSVLDGDADGASYLNCDLVSKLHQQCINT